jgi:MFS transporter, ACS family, tartrate transporter
MKADLTRRSPSAKAARRLIPFLILCYFVAYLDRVNAGFAALTMNRELGLTAEMFGFGAGIFFFGYFIFEVPSNLILEKIGARRWIARIMISWGVISAGFAFVPAISATLQGAGLSFLDNARMFYIMRFIFGAAEAGFFPGIILYLTYWFTAHERARWVGGSSRRSRYRPRSAARFQESFSILSTGLSASAAGNGCSSPRASQPFSSGRGS